MVQCNVDSLALDLPIDILPKLKAFGAITTVKNSLMLIDDKNLLKSFKCGDEHYYTYLAKIKSHKTGLEYNLTQHSRAKAITITFKGLYQYNSLSETITKDYKTFMAMFHKNSKLSRIDLAADSSNKPKSLTTIADNTKRKAFKYKNTTYFKTSKEKKTNQHLDIKYYRKKTIHIITHRIEFCFKKRYLNGNTDEIKERCQKTIQKALDTQVEVDFSLLTNWKQPHHAITHHPSAAHSHHFRLPIKLINKTIKQAVKQALKQAKNLSGLIKRLIRLIQ
jgi:hypothetical protein